MAFESALARVVDIIDFIPGELRAVRFRLPDDIDVGRRPGNSFWLRLIGARSGKPDIRAYSFSDSTLTPVFETVADEVEFPNVSRTIQYLNKGDNVEVRIDVIDGKKKIFINPQRKLELGADEQWAKKKYCFLGYGTGVTPLLSIFRYMASCDLPCDVVFLASAKTYRHLIFHDDLLHFEKMFRGRLRYYPTITRQKKEELLDWEYGIGRFVDVRFSGEQKLIEACPDLGERHLWFCGGRPALKDLEIVLERVGIKPLGFKAEVW